MNIYIAYKYTNVEDKESLKKDLERISDILVEKGHNTFVLGRDHKRWSSINHPLSKTIPVIFKNIKESDKVVAYITGAEKSPGLSFEMLCTKILGKPVTIITRGENAVCPLAKCCVKDVIEIESVDELQSKLLI